MKYGADYYEHHACVALDVAADNGQDMVAIARAQVYATLAQAAVAEDLLILAQAEGLHVAVVSGVGRP